MARSRKKSKQGPRHQDKYAGYGPQIGDATPVQESSPQPPTVPFPPQSDAWEKWSLWRPLITNTETLQSLRTFVDELRTLGGTALKTPPAENLRCWLLPRDKIQQALEQSPHSLPGVHQAVHSRLPSHPEEIKVVEEPRYQMLPPKYGPQRLDIYLTSPQLLAHEATVAREGLLAATGLIMHPPRVIGVRVAWVMLKQQPHEVGDYTSLVDTYIPEPFTLGSLSTPRAFPPITTPVEAPRIGS